MSTWFLISQHGGIVDVNHMTEFVTYHIKKLNPVHTNKI